MLTRGVWLAALAATGCGRLGFDADAPAPDAGPAIEVAPKLCETSSWGSIAFPDPDVDLAVATTPNGATVAWVPVAGGDVSGTNIGTDWQLAEGGGAVVKTGSWRRLALAYLDTTLTLSVTEFSEAKVDLIQPDLSSLSEIACPLATGIGGPPLMHAGPDRIFPIARDTGVTVIPFDASFSEMSSMLTVPSNPVTDMSATTVGNTAVIVWSTADSCYGVQVMDMATGVTRTDPSPCASPALVADAAGVVFAFERPEGVYLARGTFDTINPQAALLIAPGATAPQLAFDGRHTWLSYRASSGSLVIGYLASDGSLLTTTTTSSPTRDAYSLTIVNGEPWLFAVDTGGLGARRFCIQP